MAAPSPGTSSKARSTISTAPDAVAVDKSYFKDLGIDGIGANAEINGQRVQVTAVTSTIRSFTTLPYVFMPITRARTARRRRPRAVDLSSW